VVGACLLHQALVHESGRAPQHFHLVADGGQGDEAYASLELAEDLPRYLEA
jgi:hypothetical protein